MPFEALQFPGLCRTAIKNVYAFCGSRFRKRTSSGTGPQLLRFVTGANKLTYLRTWPPCYVQKARRSQCVAILALKRFNHRLSQETFLIFLVLGLCWATK